MTDGTVLKGDAAFNSHVYIIVAIFIKRNIVVKKSVALIHYLDRCIPYFIQALEKKF